VITYDVGATSRYITVWPRASNRMLPGLTRRRHPSAARLSYPAEIAFDLAAIVSDLHTRSTSNPNARQRFLAHHSCVLLGLLRHRQMIREKLEPLGLSQDEDDDEPAPQAPTEDEISTALVEGARTLCVVLDAITRTAHTKKFTLMQNKNVYSRALTVLSRTEEEWVDGVLAPQASDDGSRKEFRKNSGVKIGRYHVDSKDLCVFFQQQQERNDGNSINISEDALKLLVGEENKTILLDQNEPGYCEDTDGNYYQNI